MLRLKLLVATGQKANQRAATITDDIQTEKMLCLRSTFMGNMNHESSNVLENEKVTGGVCEWFTEYCFVQT